MTTIPPFAEYCPVSLAEPLRQGDILECADPEAPPWTRHLMVITANCDFAHDKHQGRVTCIPLLRKDEYLLELQVPKFREQVYKRLITAIREAPGGIAKSGISDDRLRAWPLEQTTEQILQALGVESKNKEIIGGIVDGIRMLGASAKSLSDATRILVAAQLKIPQSKSEAKLISELTGKLQGPFRNPPGDALFLSCFAEGHQQGYFAYLRHLEQVWQYAIALGPSRSAVEYRRISRLRETYTHALVQRFALVYMSIGLPDEYEEMRDLHAELLGEEF